MVVPDCFSFLEFEFKSSTFVAMFFIVSEISLLHEPFSGVLEEDMT